MNEKQFDLFQASIQWAVDYTRHYDGFLDGREKMSEWDSQTHNQGLWVHGEVDTTKVVFTSDDNVSYYPVCGTSCCLAGKAVILNGDQPVVWSDYGGGSSNEVVTDDGRLMRVSERARELFGITSGQAATMFNGDNSADRLVQEGTRIARYYGHDLTVI